MKYLLFVPFLAFTLLYSCKKDDPQAASPTLEFGNTTNMNVQTFNKVYHLYNQDSINIDVNNNGTIDLKFYINQSTTGSAKDEYSAYMYSPSKELAINGYFVADTTYYFNTTLVDTDSNSTKVWVTEVSNFNCYRLNPTDKVVRTIDSNFKMWYYTNSDKINSDNTYSTEFNFPLWMGKSDGQPHETSVSGDTTYLALNKYGLNCHSIGDGEKYIAFKLNDTQKLGWIKIKYISSSSLKIIEVALQK